MKFIHYASAALLVIGFALAAPAAGNAASPLIAGAMTGPVQPAAGGFAGLVQKVDRLTYFDKKVIEYPRYHPRYNHHRYNQRQHHRYRHYNRNRGGDGVYFNFGGRGGGFTFGVQPSYRVYERPRYYRRDYRGSSASAHISWCYDRYRSYRQRDNSFQPYHGPRKQCISPYY